MAGWAAKIMAGWAAGLGFAALTLGSFGSQCEPSQPTRKTGFRKILQLAPDQTYWQAWLNHVRELGLCHRPHSV